MFLDFHFCNATRQGHFNVARYFFFLHYLVSERKLGCFVQIKEDDNFNRPA